MADASFSIEGSLTRDPELKFTNNGKAVCNFSVAVNRKKGDEEYVSYFDCTAFGSQAENIANSHTKGSRVVLFGTLTQDRFETQDGQKRSAVKLLVDSIGTSVRFGTTTYSKTGQAQGPPKEPEYAF